MGLESRSFRNFENPEKKAKEEESERVRREAREAEKEIERLMRADIFKGVLDSDIDNEIEKKSLYEKKDKDKDEDENLVRADDFRGVLDQNSNNKIDSFDALFLDVNNKDTLSKLEIIDDEDRQAAFNAREIGKAFVPEMDTKELENAELQEVAEMMAEEYAKLFGLTPEILEKMNKDLEDRINDSF
jgi:hypothetical protein